MSKREKSSEMKEVFVLGAGASAASADTPLGRDLVWYYHRDCSLLIPIINGMPDNTEENKIFTNFEKFLILVERYYPELKGELEKWHDRGENLYHPPHKRPYVDEILAKVQKEGDIEGTELLRTLIFEHIVGSSFDSQNQLYRKFVQRVLQLKEPDSVSIISFNFDSLLCKYFGRAVPFDYLLNFDWIDPPRRDQYKQTLPTIPLIKLNGSLDWGICPQCSRLHLHSPHMTRIFFDDKQCSNGCGRINPLIIIPHQLQKEKLDILWVKAEDELSHASKITIIGYSFPDYDYKVVELFKKALNHQVEVDVVDYAGANEDHRRRANCIERQYKRLFPGLIRDINISLDGFDGYLQKYGGLDN